jgi:hypothetical protein
MDSELGRHRAPSLIALSFASSYGHVISTDRRRLAMARMVAVPAFLITLATASAAAIAVQSGGGESEAAGTAATPGPNAEAAKKPKRYEDH